MTSKNELILKYVLHVPDIRKNLVSYSFLSKTSFKLVFISDKFILTKNDVYVGKRYITKGLFKFNVMTVNRQSAINKATTFAYIIES